MPFPYAGELLSMLAALAWAAAVILYRRSEYDGDPVGFNLFKCLVAVPLFLLTLVATGTPLVPDRPWHDWLLLAGSGVIGISLADSLFFAALARTGAGLLAIVDAAYSPAVIVLSSLFLGERMGLAGTLGALLVVLAILVGTQGRPVEHRTRRDVVVGILLGVLAVVAMAVAIVMVKNVLGEVPVLWATAVRVLGGTLGLLPMLALRGTRRELARVFRPDRRWAFAVPGAALGAYGSMILWVAGMKFTLASVASVLNQLSTIFIAIFAMLFLREPLGPRRIVAVVLALAGALLTTLR